METKCIGSLLGEPPDQSVGANLHSPLQGQFTFLTAEPGLQTLGFSFLCGMG